MTTPTTERSEADGVPEFTKQAVRDALLGVLGDALDCTRVWSAWSYGTMGQDDFVPVSERVDEFVDAVLPLILAERERHDWQPIETAPRDGTRILVARFASEPADKNGYMLADWWRDRERDDVSYTGFGGFNEYHWPATHWMPLPAHPRPTPSATDSAGETR